MIEQTTTCRSAAEAALQALIQRLAVLIVDCDLSPTKVSVILGVTDVMQLSPHRPPSALVERRIVWLVDALDYANLCIGGRTAVGQWLEHRNEPVTINDLSHLERLMIFPDYLPSLRRRLQEQCIEAGFLPALGRF